jgi:hypothetical protein
MRPGESTGTSGLGKRRETIAGFRKSDKKLTATIRRNGFSEWPLW